MNAAEILHPNPHSPPFFVASGPIASRQELLHFSRVIDSAMAPLLTFKSTSEQPEIGNASRNDGVDFYYDRSLGAANCIGLANEGIDYLVSMKDVFSELNDAGIRTIVSLTSLPYEEPTMVLPRLASAVAELQPTAIELNMSCQNKDTRSGIERPICEDIFLSAAIVDAVRREVGESTILGVKDSSHALSLDAVDSAAIREFMEAVLPSINFVTGVNGLGYQDVPQLTAMNGVGSLSGPPIADIAKMHLEVVKELHPQLAYLSCGGVDSSNVGQETHERIATGALLVGGAQEYYRSSDMANTYTRWVEAYVQSY